MFLAGGRRWALKEGDVGGAEVEGVHAAARVAPTQNRLIRVHRVRPDTDISIKNLVKVVFMLKLTIQTYVHIAKINHDSHYMYKQSSE